MALIYSIPSPLILSCYQLFNYLVNVSLKLTIPMTIPVVSFLHCLCPPNIDTVFYNHICGCNTNRHGEADLKIICYMNRIVSNLVFFLFVCMFCRCPNPPTLLCFCSDVKFSPLRVLNLHGQSSPVTRAPSMPPVDTSYIPPPPPLIQDYRHYYHTPSDLPG